MIAMKLDEPRPKLKEVIQSDIQNKTSSEQRQYCQYITGKFLSGKATTIPNYECATLFDLRSDATVNEQLVERFRTGKGNRCKLCITKLRRLHSQVSSNFPRHSRCCSLMLLWLVGHVSGLSVRFRMVCDMDHVAVAQETQERSFLQ